MADVRILVNPPIAETAKSWGFLDVHREITWVPKSQADLLDEVHAGSERLILSVASWLNNKNDLEGLIGQGHSE